MRIGNRRTWAALSLLLLLGGFAAGWGIPHFRGSCHHRAAEKALERRDFREAGIELKRCLEFWPNDPPTLLLAARTARRAGNHEEALRLLQVCERKGEPSDALTLEYNLLRLQQADLSDADRLMSFCADNPGTPETPLILEAIIEGSLAHVGTRLKSVDPSLNQPERRMSRMPDTLKRAIALWPRVSAGNADRVQGLVWRGRLHNFANEYEEALADLRQALELDPTHFEARLHLALSVAGKAPKEAVDQLEVLRQRHPDNVQVLFGLATGRRSLGEFEEAKQLLDEVLAAHPGEASALFERGLVALDARQFDEAERWLRRAMARTSKDPDIFNSLSSCLRLAGKEAEASLYYKKFLELDAERRR